MTSTVPDHFPDIHALNTHLFRFAQQAREALCRNDYPAAQAAIEQVLAIVPNHKVALADLAFVKMRQNRFQEAYEHAMCVLALSGENPDPNAYDTLVSICVGLDREEEAFHFARLAMKTKKAQAQGRNIFPLPSEPPKGLSDDPARNIISYSLYGSRPRYCEAAVVNVQLAKRFYPEWTCRFYVDESVPENVLDRLKEAGAQVIFASPEQRQFAGLFWRFAVAEDPNVQCFLVRDVDSLLSRKERAAVDEWLASQKWFHLMRDNLGHHELILAGMWGGYTGVFHHLNETILTLLAEMPSQNNMIDQVFLRYQIYPTVAQSVLEHDSRLLEPTARAFPDYTLSEVEKIPHFHIGMVDAHARTLTLNVRHPTAPRVRWYLLDRENRVICQYEDNVPANRKVPINLPFFYVEKVESGEYHFVDEALG